ncbi:unnamed protein product [Schistosoma margrebowiei]|uniref:Uncharacterized protein n=1 Tax=Schistosoma margrebowiei TaxID=48269 RepID=A0A183MZ66_9TREM|nr:unnamed protein product [Schistosoma margrebowiei]
MLYDQVTPRPNVWKADISAIQEYAAKTDWLVDTSISVEEAWSVFKDDDSNHHSSEERTTSNSPTQPRQRRRRRSSTYA